MLRALLIAFLLVVIAAPERVSAQTFPFTSGPIAPCDTSTFTANVGGVGWLIIPDGWSWGSYLEGVLINITTDHPQTLQISLTSPAGTTLLLSAFNGAGGQNYTNTNFGLWAWNPITSGTAPFTGTYAPQGGSLDVFANQNADGVWTLTVIDTACTGTNPGTGGAWTPGWLNGGSGSGDGAIAFGFSAPPPPCIIDMGNQSFTTCPGETVNILAPFEQTFGQAGVSFNVYGWPASPPDPYAVSIAGYYTIEGWDWSGCSYYGSVDVSLAQGVALGPDQVLTQCSGEGPADLGALLNTANATIFSWTLDGAPIADANAATIPGVYELTASNAGCSDVAQVTLVIDSAPVLGPDQALTICEGTATDLTTLFDTGGLPSNWSMNGAAIAAPTGASSTGSYVVSVTTAQGCADTAAVMLTVQALPSLGSDQAIGLCDGSTADLTALFAVGALNTEWTAGGTVVSDASAVSAGGAYQLIASDAAGCSDTAVVDVTLWPAPSLGADAATTICAGATVDLTSFFSTVGLADSWMYAGAVVSDPSAVYAAGAYTLMVTDANGCTDDADVIVSIAANPMLGADHQMNACDGSTVDLNQVFATGADAVDWTLNGAPVIDASAVSVGGDYTLIVTNAAGCTDTAMVSLTMDPSPALGADATAAICEGSSFDLTALYATTGLTESWSYGGAALADASAVLDAGSYRLVVANGFGCTDTAVVALVVNANPSLGADQSFTLCPWQMVDLSAVFPVSGLTASYTMNGASLIDPTAVADSGAYVISVTDANGCMDEAVAEVIQVECLCEADFITDAHCIQDRSRFTVVADSMVVTTQWDFGGSASPALGSSPEVVVETEGEVLVTMHAQLTCGLVTVQRTITLSDCSDSCSVFIPNTFTPNNDEINDAWAWVGDCKPDEFRMMVFNRWGELVYTTEDPTAKWDGTYQGVVSQNDVYVYRVSYRLPYQDRKERMGHVTLLR